MPQPITGPDLIVIATILALVALLLWTWATDSPEEHPNPSHKPGPPKIHWLTVGTDILIEEKRGARIDFSFTEVPGKELNIRVGDIVLVGYGGRPGRDRMKVVAVLAHKFMCRAGE